MQYAVASSLCMRMSVEEINKRGQISTLFIALIDADLLSVHRTLYNVIQSNLRHTEHVNRQVFGSKQKKTHEQQTMQIPLQQERRVLPHLLYC